MTDRLAVPGELIIPSGSAWQVLGNHPSLLFHHSANHQKKMAPIHHLEIADDCLSIICQRGKLYGAREELKYQQTFPDCSDVMRGEGGEGGSDSQLEVLRIFGKAAASLRRN